MMWKGVSTACIVHIMSSLAVADTAPENNIFNESTLSSSGLFGDFDREVDGIVGGHPEEFVLKGTNSSEDAEDAEDVEDTEEPQFTKTARLRHHQISDKNRKKYLQKKMKKKKKDGGGRNGPPRRPRPPRPGSAPSQRPPRRPRPNRPSRPASYERPPDRNSSPCFSRSLYDSIDTDIAAIKESIRSSKDRSHFLGGIVRLAAHDFMDFDRRAPPRDMMGPDGCIDPSHPSNGGLEEIWCRDCILRKLYARKYSRISRADFWIASANAVIRQTSVDGALDLRDTFAWGRRDRDDCRGSGERLPEASGCDQVEDVFLRNMGLGWGEAVALLGAHTLGRGDSRLSGHGGTWVSSDEEAQVFDKQYYEEFFTNAWRPRKMGGKKQDWTTGSGHDRLMLNTDMCLVFDIDENVDRDIPCCTRTGSDYPNGQDQCVDMEAARRRCPMYSQHNRRRAATDAVREMMGGSVSSNNNAPFYIAFAKAWKKATTVGIPQNVLRPLQDRC